MAQDGAPWRIWSRTCRRTPIDCTTGHHCCSQYLGDGQELGAGWGAVEYLEQNLWPPSKSCGSTGRAPYIRRLLPIWPGARPAGRSRAEPLGVPQRRRPASRLHRAWPHSHWAQRRAALASTTWPGRLAAGRVGGGEDRREASCPRARARPAAAVRDPLARWPPCRRYRRHPRSPFSRSSQHLPRAATETKAGGNGSARGKGGGEQVPAFGGG